MSHRNLTALVLSVGLVAVGCGGDDSGETSTVDSTVTEPAATESSADPDAPDETTTTTGPVALTASWPGITEEVIRLGFLEVDLETLRELGLVDIDRGEPQLVLDTLIDELNSRGGILGRTVEASLEIVLPIQTSDAEAACLRLTEDADVFAVLGQFAGPTTEVDPCITDTGQTIMIGGNPTPDQLARARAPWLTTGMGAGRRLAAAVGLMHDEGVIGESVAVAYATEDEGAANTLVIPELERLGYDVAEKVVQTSGSDDRVAQAGEWATFIEAFRAAGVDTVVLVQSTVAFTGSNQLVLHGFEGQILIVDAVSTLSSIGTSSENPTEDLDGIVGTIGPSAEEGYDLDATQECIDVLEAAHPEIVVTRSDLVAEGEPDWGTTLLGMCSRLRLFEAIAAAAGPNPTHESFLAAAEALGDVDLPGNPFSSLGPGKLDASDSLRLAVFDSTIDADGGSTPLTDLMRVTG